MQELHVVPIAVGLVVTVTMHWQGRLYYRPLQRARGCGTATEGRGPGRYAMVYETLLEERRGEGGILWVTLNRPEKLNALSGTLFRELKEICDRTRRDRSVRCMVITGAGRGFCAGADFSGSDPIRLQEPQPFPDDPSDLEA